MRVEDVMEAHQLVVRLQRVAFVLARASRGEENVARITYSSPAFVGPEADRLRAELVLEVSVEEQERLLRRERDRIEERLAGLGVELPMDEKRTDS